MNPSSRLCLVGVVLLAVAAPLPAQPGPGAEKPGVHVPAKVASAKDLDHLEALRLYGQGLLHEKQHRLLDALKSYEQAMRLDPDAATLHRAVIPIYLALDRTDEALAEFARVAELDPADVQTQFFHARQLRGMNKTKEAVAVLQKLTGNEALKARAGLRAQVFFDLAALHESAEQWADAEKALRQLAATLDDPAIANEDGALSAADLKTQAAETWERIGRLCVRANRPDEAIVAFENAQKRDPACAQRLAFALADLQEKQGKSRDALGQVDTYLRMQPQGVEAYELKVRLLRKLDRGGEVLAQLEAAAAADTHNTALKLLLAREYRAAKQLAKAETLYRAVIKDNPSPEAFKGLLAVYKDDGDAGARRLLEAFNEAVGAAVDKKAGVGDANQAAVARGLLLAAHADGEMVKRLLTAADQSLRTGGRPLKTPALAPATRNELARLAARSHQLAFAEKLFRSCLTDGTLTPDTEVDIYSGLLTVLLLAHKYDAVLEVCEQGAKKAENTNRVMFFMDKAEALMALDRPDEAIAAAKEAKDIAPDKNQLLARRNYASILSQAGKHEAAVAECQALLKAYNQSNNAGDVRNIRLMLSTVYLAAQKYDESEKQLQLLLEADPGDALIHNNLGYQWADRGKNLDEAEKLIRKALELDHQARVAAGMVGPDADQPNAAYVDSLGWLLFRRGQLDAAREQLELATTLPEGDDDPTVWDHLGDVYSRRDEKDKALAAYKKSLELFGTSRRRIDERKKDVEQKVKRLEPR